MCSPDAEPGAATGIAAWRLLREYGVESPMQGRPAAEGVMRFPRFLAVGLVLVYLPAGYAGETVANPQLGFRLSVPDGFVREPERVQGQVVYAFQRPPEGEQKVGTFIVVSRLGGVIGREKLDPKVIASKNPQVSLTSERWKAFDIEVFRVPEQSGELQLLTFNTQGRPEQLLHPCPYNHLHGLLRQLETTSCTLPRFTNVDVLIASRRQTIPTRRSTDNSTCSSVGSTSNSDAGWRPGKPSASATAVTAWYPPSQASTSRPFAGDAKS
ncbi:hypothetical protein [Fimbriiglobus ruber]|uniref:hypothetical protein n=1 Tax=Fimbriiglobus ruber TaxID=1908690 RepID=UPI00137A19F0|nr:hypothetical protein [Fimbriiglobus ruber]